MNRFFFKKESLEEVELVVILTIRKKKIGFLDRILVYRRNFLFLFYNYHILFE